MSIFQPTPFPGGITIWGGYGGGGVPLLPNPSASYFGNIWFVDTVNGSDGNSGTGPGEAFATMGRALWFDTITAGAGTTSNVGPNDTIYFVGKVRQQLIAPLTKTVNGTAVAVTGVKIVGMAQGNVRDDDGAKWYAPASPTAGMALIEIRQQGWEFHSFLMSPDTTSGACIKAHRAEDATYPDSSHFICNGMRFVGGSLTTTYGIQDVGGNHHYIVNNCEFQTLTFGIYCSSTAVAVPLRNTIQDCKFMGNTNDIASSQTNALIQRNKFFTAGSGATNKVISTTYNAVQGGTNQVLLNQFNNTEAQIAPASGFTGAATDVWMNYVTDQAALAFGQPA